MLRPFDLSVWCMLVCIMLICVFVWLCLLCCRHNMHISVCCLRVIPFRVLGIVLVMFGAACIVFL